MQARRFQGFAEADLRLNQFDSPDPTGAGNPVVYTLKVSNLTPASTAIGTPAIDAAIGTATSVHVVSRLPAGAHDVTTSGDRWNCAVDGDVADCAYTRPLRAADVAPPLKIQLVPGGTVEPSIRNVAKVSADQADPRPEDNRDVETTLFAN